VDAGLLDAEDMENHPESNVITRAVGFRELPRPDLWTLPVRTGLRLLICSDGLTKELGRERIRLHLAARLSAAETASALVDAALAAGGRDNVTVLVVDVVEAPATHPRSGAAPV
jgi:protein phosphatase